MTDRVDLEEDYMAAGCQNISLIQNVASHKYLTSANPRIDTQVGEHAVRRRYRWQQRRRISLFRCDGKGPSCRTYEISWMPMKNTYNIATAPDLAKHQLGHLNVGDRTILAISVVLIDI